LATPSRRRGRFDHTFDNIARVIGELVDSLGITRYVMYVFDYGDPTGFRLGLVHPERVAAIISQNGKAYLEGLSKAWNSWQTYWRSPGPRKSRSVSEIIEPAPLSAISSIVTEADAQRISPDGYTLDLA
jgi:pimeloyl-ACP methyl ester carboxylesterase